MSIETQHCKKKLLSENSSLRPTVYLDIFGNVRVFRANGNAYFMVIFRPFDFQRKLRKTKERHFSQQVFCLFGRGFRLSRDSQWPFSCNLRGSCYFSQTPFFKCPFYMFLLFPPFFIFFSFFVSLLPIVFVLLLLLFLFSSSLLLPFNISSSLFSLEFTLPDQTPLVLTF